MPNELSIVNTQNLSTETIAKIDAQVDTFIAKHKENSVEINRIVFDGTAALVAGDNLAQNMGSHGKLKRFWRRFNGDNSRTQDTINANLIEAQYAAQKMIQKLAEQNLLTFELIAALNNSLNAQIEEVHDNIIDLKRTLVNFFKNVRAEVVRLNRTEKNVNILTWQNSIEYQMYNGVEYQDLDDATKIVCLAKDFYEITAGTWTTSDLLLLKTAMATIGLNPRDKISIKDFVGKVGTNNALCTHLFGDNAQFATENERIAFALKNHHVLSNAAAPHYEFILELLCNMRQLEYAKKIHEKLLAAKKLFLECKIAEALPLLEETADAGESEARYMLATIYKEGLAGKKNPERVALLTAGTVTEENSKALKRRADDGDVFAQYEMAQYHLNAAKEYLQQSADQNYFLALYELGLIYYAGVGVEKDYVKAKEYFKRGADMRHGLSMAYLANIYRKEIDCSTVNNFQSGINETDSFLKKIGKVLFEGLRVLGSGVLIYDATLKVIECYEKAYIYDKNIESRYDNYFEELHICKINRLILESFKKIDGSIEDSLSELYRDESNKSFVDDYIAANAWSEQAEKKRQRR